VLKEHQKIKVNTSKIFNKKRVLNHALSALMLISCAFRQYANEAEYSCLNKETVLLIAYTEGVSSKYIVVML